MDPGHDARSVSVTETHDLPESGLGTFLMQDTLTSRNDHLSPAATGAGAPAPGTTGLHGGRQQQVADAALARLAESSVAELRSLRVDRKEDKLQLSGRVRSFYHKQLAQETVRTVAAGMQVINAVAVSPRS